MVLLDQFKLLTTTKLGGCTPLSAFLVHTNYKIFNDFLNDHPKSFPFQGIYIYFY